MKSTYETERVAVDRKQKLRMKWKDICPICSSQSCLKTQTKLKGICHLQYIVCVVELTQMCNLVMVMVINELFFFFIHSFIHFIISYYICITPKILNSPLNKE